MKHKIKGFGVIKMKVLRVNLDEKSYDIVIQKDLKDYFGEYIKTVFDGKKVAIITDDNLNDIYNNYDNLGAIRHYEGYIEHIYIFYNKMNM